MLCGELRWTKKRENRKCSYNSKDQHGTNAENQLELSLISEFKGN